MQNAITVGSVSASFYEDADRQLDFPAENPSSFSRSGFRDVESIKPELVEFGGEEIIDGANPPRLTIQAEASPELVRSTMYGGPPFARDVNGTSFSAPKVMHIVGHVESLLPGQSTQLYRALVINSARWPLWAEAASVSDRPDIIRSIGYGVPTLARATENSPTRVTLITSEEFEIAAAEGLIFGVTVPEELRRPGEDFTVRVDVTLAYVAEPRRTRTSRRGYLGVWLDWKSSKKGEDFEAFRNRALRDDDEPESSLVGNIRWTLGNRRDRDGATDGVSRSRGTVQKDWAYLQSYELPNVFGVVVRGHHGWARRDEAARARFCLVVTFEAVGAEIPIYDVISQAIEAEVETQLGVEVPVPGQ